MLQINGHALVPELGRYIARGVEAIVARVVDDDIDGTPEPANHLFEVKLEGGGVGQVTMDIDRRDPGSRSYPGSKCMGVGVGDIEKDDLRAPLRKRLHQSAPNAPGSLADRLPDRFTVDLDRTKQAGRQQWRVGLIGFYIGEGILHLRIRLFVAYEPVDPGVCHLDNELVLTGL